MGIWEFLAAIITAIIVSGGFWGWLIARHEKQSRSTKLLMGLASDKITFLGLNHIRRGYISKDEYEDFRNYLYDPYVNLGGNGSAKRIMDEVDKLPFYRPNLQEKLDEK